jgi:pectate lyase
MLAVLLFGLAVATHAAFAAGSVSSYHRQNDDWFRSDAGRQIIKNVISWQAQNGAWPKNVDTTRPTTASPQKGTFDNGATTEELRLLARAFNATRDSAVQRSFLQGLDVILRAQYPTGGWPQSYPPGEGYHRHITFNDQAMIRLMRFLRDVATHNNYGFVDEQRRQSSRAAFERGLDCILRAQIRVDGKLTVWCAQHDERTLEPRPARSYELVSLSGAESVGILDLLMSVEQPSREVIAAVDAGVAWFNHVQVRGVNQIKINGDKRIVPDPGAPPLWARFYEIGTNRPIFASRDGIKKYSLDEIDSERRNGYAWYGHWGKDLPRKFRDWNERISRPAKRDG